MASYGPLPPRIFAPRAIEILPPAPSFDQQTIHIHDLVAARKMSTRAAPSPRATRHKNFPQHANGPRRDSHWTNYDPSNEGPSIHCKTGRSTEFLKTFADQAVIALENVRLFQELKESLEQQTATSEIFGVIASSPTDIQPVLDAIAQNAARVCGADDATIRLLEGEEMVFAAHFGTIPPGGQGRRTLGFRSVGNQALVQRRTIHIPDLQAESESFPDSSHMGTGIRTFLVTPLLREGTGIGVMTIRRTEVKPFTDRQVALLETFAVAGGHRHRECSIIPTAASSHWRASSVGRGTQSTRRS